MCAIYYASNYLKKEGKDCVQCCLWCSLDRLPPIGELDPISGVKIVLMYMMRHQFEMIKFCET